ncbi:MAG TPA: LAGLIDADG family homing endonuclease, partial [Paenisporosarcina sp.]|nr:LAGLIDADG family homing endonuclease [Paenisporosarcina sp.]
MSLVKLGEAVQVRRDDIHSAESVLHDPDILARMSDDSDILDQFRKFAENLKHIAPKAKDFLYFSAVMMSAAEAVLLEPDGTIRKDAAGKELSAGWEKKGDSWRWVCSDPSIMPYKNSNCFVPGTKILMADGSAKNIEDIKAGDLVVTHKNRVKKVIRTFETPFNGSILEIQSSRNEKIKCTEEHPFYIARAIGKDSNKHRAFKNGNVDFRFVEASKLEDDDRLLGPVLSTIVESDINENKARLLGNFCAEGSYSKNKNGELDGLVLTYSHLEYDNLCTEIKELFEKEFNVTATLCKGTPSQPTKSTIYVYSKEIANYFYKHIGEYSLHKKLSSELVFSSKNVKLSFIAGWAEGDGHVDKDSGKLVLTTVSHDLASQARTMLASLQINNCVYFETRPESCIKDRLIASGHAYRVKIPYNECKELIKNSNKLRFELSNVKNVKNVKVNAFINDSYSVHPIIEKRKIDYNGNVYNFQVEDDNSYVANGVVVHNCDIFPEEELIKAHKKWVGRPLCLDHKSSSVDMIRGVIVDTYYDRKHKRVIALCALDKINYPDLARKVSTGYATSVSM